MARQIDTTQVPEDNERQPLGPLRLLPRDMTDTAEQVDLALKQTPSSYYDRLELLEDPISILGGRQGLQAAKTRVGVMPDMVSLVEEFHGHVGKALLKQAIPSMPKDRIDLIANLPGFDQLEAKLVVWKTRIMPRTPGVTYFLEKATQHLYYQEGGDFVDRREYKGFVFRIDIRGFTESVARRGAKATSQTYAEHFFKPLFEILRSYPGIKFMKTIGDEVILTSTEITEQQAIDFSAILTSRLTGVEAHIGIGNEQFSTTITPEGQLVIQGPAMEDALEAQEISKNTPPEGLKKVYLSAIDNGIVTIPIDSHPPLPAAPTHSAMHFFKGLALQRLEAVFQREPEHLLESLDRHITKQMALVASTMPQTSIEMERTTERRATSLYLKAPNINGTSEEALIKWEKEAKQIAEKYQSSVLFIDVTSKTKVAIIIFGAQGSTPFDQEERASQCANELTTTYHGSVAGIETGDILISSMEGSIETYANCVNISARLVYTNDSKKAQGDGTIQPIRLGPNAAARFRRQGIKVGTDESIVNLQIKGIEGRVPIKTGTSLRIAETVEGYIRQDIVEALVSHIEGHETGAHINVSGDPGIGKTRAISVTGKKLRESLEMAVAELPRYHNKHKSYDGIAKVLEELFPTEDDLLAWSESQGIGETQMELWRTIFREVQGVQNPKLTQDINSTKEQIRKLLQQIGKTAVICPNFRELDNVSKEILQESQITLITTGAETAEAHHQAKGISQEEALKIVASKLEIGASLLPQEIADFIGENEAGHNPLLVEALAEALIETGALTRDPLAFNKEKAESIPTHANVKEFQLDHVRDKIRTIEGDAMSLLKTAVMFGGFSLTEFDILRPILPAHAIQVLEEERILTQNGSIKFLQPFFVEIGRTLPETRLDLEEAKLKELLLRKHCLPNGLQVPRYFEAMESIGLGLSTEVVSTIKNHSNELINKERAIEAMDITEQFISTLPAQLPIETLNEGTLNHIAQIAVNRVKAKITLGRSTVDDMRETQELFAQYRKSERGTKALGQLEGELIDLKCKAAYTAQRTDDLIEAVNELMTFYTENPPTGQNLLVIPAAISLRKAQKYYRIAGQEGLTLDERREHMKQAMRELRFAMPATRMRSYLSDEIKKFKVAADNYDIFSLRNRDPEREAQHIAEAQQLLNPESVKREDLYYIGLALIRSLAMKGDIEEAQQTAQNNLQTAKERCYTDIALKTLNYLLNVIQIKGEKAAGNDTLQGINILMNENEEAYSELIQIQSELSSRDLEGASTTILTSIDTNLGSLTEALKLLEANPWLIANNTMLAFNLLETTRSRLEELRKFAEEHPQAKATKIDEFTKATTELDELLPYMETLITENAIGVA